MKRIIPFFAVCLGLSVVQTGVVFGADNTRSLAKRDVAETTTPTRQKSDKNRTDSARNTTYSRTVKTPTIQTRGVTTVRPTTKSRTTSENTSKVTVSRTRNANSAQNAVTARSTTTPKKTTASRVAVSGKKPLRTTTRAATLNPEKITELKSQDYSKCKNVYYNCMDEFCANKDTSLRRCACSARIHEFDTIKKQLSNAEDKMLDFNQRLLVVGLDKEDAAAISVATEGENGYNKSDISGSEKLLRKITDALNSSGKTKINNDLSAISLSLDADSAWDSIDSVAGISTTSKSGVDLYNAAQPICIEMAKEVCSEHELEITQNSYQLSIQQDCNTVAKSYDAKYNQAIEKIHESSALLDMSRLNIYQQRNSDDILTCKHKILEKMTDSSVCGEQLQKCLDVTGQYINPSTGNAFLSNDLYNITALLTAPTGNEKWSKVPQNQQFVSFLNSKKTFLEPAIEQCQDIADTVWKDFLDDALGQIKLAQTKKVEEIRQSCTTLVAECKSNSQQNLVDFDARALSTFEVIADATTNTICADVENSCISLLDASGGGATEWATGITGIAADISYDAIINNCTTVGKDCIIQQCNGTAGNFALCGDFSAGPRRAILKHTACWDEVLACVQQSANLDNITTDITQNRDSYYTQFYADNPNMSDVPAPCGPSDTASKACLITEQIWGNCEHDPATTAITTNANLTQFATQNKILTPKLDTDSTLLSWLAYNTGTTDANDSCSAYNCPINYKYDSVTKTCQRMRTLTNQSKTTDDHSFSTMDEVFYVTSRITNYCQGGIASKDAYGNCCASGHTSNGICVPSSEYNAILMQQVECDTTINVAVAPNYYCPDYTSTEIPGSNGEFYYTPNQERQMAVYCVTQSESITRANNAELHCDGGYLIVVDQYGNYIPAVGIDDYNNNPVIINSNAGPTMSYKYNASTVHPNTDIRTCTYTYSGSSWQWMNGATPCNTSNIGTPVPKNNRFMITY